MLPLPIAALKSAFPVLRNPANKDRAIRLTYDQFRFGFANELSEEEAKALYDKYSVPGAGKVLFQAAFANINPATEATVVKDHPDRGPMLIISADNDHTVPWAIANAVLQEAGEEPRPDRDRQDPGPRATHSRSTADGATSRTAAERVPPPQRPQAIAASTQKSRDDSTQNSQICMRRVAAGHTALPVIGGRLGGPREWSSPTMPLGVAGAYCGGMFWLRWKRFCGS